MNHFAETVLTWLWQTSLAAAALALIALLLQALCGRWLTPRWTYVLWMLVVLRLVLPVAPESRFSIFNIHSAPERQPLATPSEPVLTTPPAVLQVPAPPPAKPLSVPIFLVTLWMLGAICYFLACVVQYLRLLRWARRQSPITDPRVLALFCSAEERLRFHRPLTIVQTQSISVAAVLGLLRPYLLLPKHMIDNWTDDELRFAMLHELVHLRRRDNLLNWMLIFVQAIHWFNPLVWFALRRARTEREALCDAIVLSNLRDDERPAYGAALIKAAELLAAPPLLCVVPILNHKHEIHRRIRMITAFKPTPRSVSVFAAIIVLLLACLTFTAAARKEKVTPPAVDGKKGEQARLHERTVKAIEAMQGEWEKLQAQIREREAALEKIRQELRIPDHVAEGDGKGSGEAEAVRRLEQLRVEAQAEIQQINSLQGQLSEMNRADRRRAITVAYGNEQLSLLHTQLAAAEQKLEAVNENYAAEHPEVKTAKRMVTLITKQIDERIDGILAGLKVKAASHDSRMKFINSEMDRLKELEVNKRSSYRPFFQAKRDLESLVTIRERLTHRIIQEKVDLAIKTSDSAPAAP
jgi:beta-lactamase regulating signal transducer with metallopeptidase domain